MKKYINAFGVSLMSLKRVQLPQSNTDNAIDITKPSNKLFSSNDHVSISHPSIITKNETKMFLIFIILKFIIPINKLNNWYYARIKIYLEYFIPKTRL